MLLKAEQVGPGCRRRRSGSQSHQGGPGELTSSVLEFALSLIRINIHCLI